MILSPSLVKRALSGHSWLGLLVGGMMYVICVSGALLVFHAELERWEQPYAPEFTYADPTGMQDTLNTFLSKGEGVTPHMYLIFPTEESPRARLATENESWFLNADGTLSDRENNTWSEMLLELHLYLHLPKTWGMIWVSALGAILVALVVSGFLSHPKIFRDAFNLRLGSSVQLEQTDIHNRISVWGAPFFLMIAITGAYFGLALPNLSLYADAEYLGDDDKAISMVFGEEPGLDDYPGRVEIVEPLEQLSTLAPDAIPLFLVLHDAGERNQHLSVSAFHPGRLVYSENYLFDTSGNFIGSEGFVDGPIGKQVIYSIYRLHFGTFAGALTKWVYFFLGLSLAVVAVTGVNIWLAKRRRTDQVNDLWVGIVWGLPIALATSASLKTLFAISPLVTFWATVVLSCLLAVWLKDPDRCRRLLKVLLSTALIVLVVIQGVVHGDSAFVGSAGGINSLFLVVASLVLLVLYWPKSASNPAAARSAEN